MRTIPFLAITLAAIGFASAAAPQSDQKMIHANHTAPKLAAPSETGQSAFAALQEVVTLLMNDPETNWDAANIEALRRHLIDMDNVTLQSVSSVSTLPEGAIFSVTAASPAVIMSIQNMVPAHAITIDGTRGWDIRADLVENGALLRVTGPKSDTAMIRALGFAGIMTVGAHHQAHHITLARGENPH